MSFEGRVNRLERAAGDQPATDVIGWVLLPFTCGISLVFIIGAHLWGLVDGIMILTGSINQDAQGKPLRD